MLSAACISVECVKIMFSFTFSAKKVEDEMEYNTTLKTGAVDSGKLSC